MANIFYSPGVSVGISQASYTVIEEDSPVTICAIVTGGVTAVPIEVVFMTASDGNAQGISRILSLVGSL